MSSQIQGIVFNDLNKNSQYDVGEPGISGAYLVLYDSLNGTCISTPSDIDGTYSFINITVAGDYLVYETVSDPGGTCPPTVFTQPTGFTESNTPRTVPINITQSNIDNNDIISDINFGHEINTNTLPCNTTAIQFAGSPVTTWYNIDLITGESVPQGGLNPPTSVNAIGYNTLDGFLYGFDQDNMNLVRIDSLGNITILTYPNGLANTGYNVGGMDDKGYLYLYNTDRTRFYVIDLIPDSPTYLKLVDSTNNYEEQTSNYGILLDPGGIDIYDWAYNPLDNSLYSVRATNGNVVKVDVDTGDRTILSTSPSPDGLFGAVFSDADGYLYAIRNSTGVVYRYTINGSSATSEVFSKSASSNNNDGAFCVNARILTDYGDAPDTDTTTQGPGNYRTLLESDGPRHGIINTLTLGTQVTAEVDAYEDTNALGDDTFQGIQDDGVTFPLTNIASNASSYTLPISVLNDTGSTANVYAWIDFNKDGVFQTNEGVTTTVGTSPSSQSINLVFTNPTIPLDPGNTFVRVRVTTDSLTNTGGATDEDQRSFGPASDGEVEDYEIIIEDTQIVSDKDVNKVYGDVDEIITYTVTLNNPGTLTIENVLFQDSTPTGTTYIGNLSVDSNYSGTAPDSGLTILQINPGETVTISWQVQVSGVIPNPNPIENIGNITIPNLTNTTTDTVSTEIRNADLSDVQKNVDKDYADVGEEITYEITFNNTGNIDADNIVIADVIPNGTTYVANSLTSTVNVTGDPTSTISLDDPLISGGSVTLSFKVLVNEIPIQNPIQNQANVSYEYLVDPVGNPTTDNHDSNIVETEIRNADLSNINKEVDKSYVEVGEEITYTITFTNSGNIEASNVQLIDSIPPGTTYVANSLVSNVLFTGDPTGTINITNDVLSGDVVSFLFRVLVTEVPTPNPISNMATINYEYLVDPLGTPVTDSQDTQTVTTQVNHGEITLTKGVDKNYVAIGEDIEYTVEFTNTGNVPLSNVSITDLIPPGTNYVNGSLAANVGISGNPNSSVNLTSPVAVGETVTLTYRVRANSIPSENPINSLAQVSYNYIVDPATPPINNIMDSNTVLTEVRNASLSGISKTVDKVYADLGYELAYSVSFTNSGNVPANNVELVDIIPNGTSYKNGTVTSNVAFSGTPDTSITLTNPVLPGETVLVVFNVSVDSIPTPNPMPNSASVNYEFTVDPNNNPIVVTNNSNTVNTRVNHGEILALNKSSNTDFVNVFGEIEYTLTFTNTGNTSVQNITIVDPVRSGTSYVPASLNVSAPYTGDLNNGIVITAPIAPGRTVTVTYRLRVNEIPDPNPIPNIATLTYDYIVNPLEPPVQGAVDSNLVEVRVNPVYLIKNCSPEEVALCDIITYTITIVNTAEVEINNVVFYDYIPNGVEYIDSSFNGAFLSLVNEKDLLTGVLIGTIPAESSKSISFEVKLIEIPCEEPLVNVASAYYEAEFEPGIISRVPNNRSNQCSINIKRIGFTQGLKEGTITLDEDAFDIESIVDLRACLECIKYEFIKTPIGKNISNQELKGKKLSIYSELNLFLQYVALNRKQSINTVNKNKVLCDYIVLPDLEYKPCDIEVSYEFENISYELVDERIIHYCITYIVESGV